MNDQDTKSSTYINFEYSSCPGLVHCHHTRPHLGVGRDLKCPMVSRFDQKMNPFHVFPDSVT